MNVEQILSAFGAVRGQPDLKLTNGVCRLLFEGETTVDIEPVPDEGALFFYSTIGQISPVETEPVYRFLLESNLFGKGTAGGTLACDFETNEIVLWRSLEIDPLTVERFETELTRFVDAAQNASARLENPSLAEVNVKPDEVTAAEPAANSDIFPAGIRI
jgi:hypothetical protein